MALNRAKEVISIELLDLFYKNYVDTAEVEDYVAWVENADLLILFS